MGPHEIHERNLARLTGHFPSSFRTEFRKDEKFQRAIADQVVKSKKCIIYQNAPGLTFDQLRQYISAAVHRHKIKGVILDYWQLVGLDITLALADPDEYKQRIRTVETERLAEAAAEKAAQHNRMQLQ